MAQREYQGKLRRRHVSSLPYHATLFGLPESMVLDEYLLPLNILPEDLPWLRPVDGRLRIESSAIVASCYFPHEAATDVSSIRQFYESPWLRYDELLTSSNSLPGSH